MIYERFVSYGWCMCVVIGVGQRGRGAYLARSITFPQRYMDVPERCKYRHHNYARKGLLGIRSSFIQTKTQQSRFFFHKEQLVGRCSFPCCNSWRNCRADASTKNSTLSRRGLMAPYKVHKQGFLQLAPLGVAKKQGQRKASLLEQKRG